MSLNYNHQQGHELLTPVLLLSTSISFYTCLPILPFIFLFSYFSRVLIVSPCLSFSLNSLFTINNLRQEMPSFINDAVNETGAAFVGDKNFNQLIPCN